MKNWGKRRCLVITLGMCSALGAAAPVAPAPAPEPAQGGEADCVRHLELVQAPFQGETSEEVLNEAAQSLDRLARDLGQGVAYDPALPQQAGRALSKLDTAAAVWAVRQQRQTGPAPPILTVRMMHQPVDRPGPSRHLRDGPHENVARMRNASRHRHWRLCQACFNGRSP